VVGLSGYAGSGKSAVAKYLVENHGFIRLSYASPIKKMIHALLREAGVGPVTIREMIDGKLKEVPSDVLGGKTPRYAMQTLGTEWGRSLIAQDLWRSILLRRMNAELDRGHRVVIDDVRFHNESKFLMEHGRVFRIERFADQQMTHISEDQSFPVDDIIANNGSLQELYAAIDARLLGVC
jgi:hypothetical protein